MHSKAWWWAVGASVVALACGDDGAAPEAHLGDAAASDAAEGTVASDVGTDDEDGRADTEATDDDADGGADVGTDDDAAVHESDSTEPTPTDDDPAVDGGLPDPSLDASAPDVSGPRPRVSFDEFCDAARAAWLAGCEESSRDCHSVDERPGAQRCRALDLGIDAGRYEFDGEAAAACMMSTPLPLFDAWDQAWLPRGECSLVFRSAAGVGDDCYPDETFNSPCGEGFCLMGASCPGTCVAHAEVGEPCASTRCVDEAYCDNANDVCLPRAGLGEGCPHGGACESGLACDEYVCKTPAELGASCGADVACRFPNICRDGTCVDRVDEGDRCTSETQCPAGLRCYEPVGGEQNVCAPLPEQGDPCNLWGPGCAGTEVYCKDVGDPEVGECQPYYVGVDEPCGDSIGDCEPELYCRRLETDDAQGTCVPDLAEGSECSNMVWQGLGNNPCQDGLLCMWGATETCLPPGQLGDPCFYNNPDSCAEQDSYCSLFSRVCEPPVELNERCNLAFPERSCREGRCELVPASNCDEAPLGDCQDMVCQALLENGMECGYSEQCSSGYCASDETGGTCAEQVDVSSLCLPE